MVRCVGCELRCVSVMRSVVCKLCKMRRRAEEEGRSGEAAGGAQKTRIQHSDVRNNLTVTVITPH